MIDPKKSSMILLICKPEINTKVKIMPMHDNRIFKSIVIIFLNSIYFSVKINAPAHTINSAITVVKAAADAPNRNEAEIQKHICYCANRNNHCDLVLLSIRNHYICS